MTDKKEMPANGGGIGQGQADGVSGTPGATREGEVQGRFAGGESSGGAYPNPHTGKGATGPGSADHGGQTEIAYHGGTNPNATTRSRHPGAGEEGREGTATPEREAHPIKLGGKTVEIVEESGVAATEATGKIATDAAYEREQESPGSG